MRLNGFAGMTLKGRVEVTCRLSLAASSSASSEKLATRLLAGRLFKLLVLVGIKFDGCFSMLIGRHLARDLDCAARLSDSYYCFPQQRIQKTVSLDDSFDGLSCNRNGDSCWRNRERGCCNQSEAQATESYSQVLQLFWVWSLVLVNASRKPCVL